MKSGSLIALSILFSIKISAQTQTQVITSTVSILPDQNPNYQKSKKKYQDSAFVAKNKLQTQSIEHIYKAIDDVRIKKDKKELAAALRQKNAQAANVVYPNYNAPNVAVMPYMSFNNSGVNNPRQGTSSGTSGMTYSGFAALLNVANAFISNGNFNNNSPRNNFNPTTPTRNSSFNDRAITVQKYMMVSNSTITINLWDYGQVDGDRISLYLNGMPVLENFTLEKNKKQIVVKLSPDSNVLVMHALNLGSVPPNTASLNINDGINSQDINLGSDLKKSGALEIIYNP